MRNKDIKHWVVIVGEPIFACKTRKQARKYAKKNKVRYPRWNYIGKCIDKKRKIILDV